MSRTPVCAVLPVTHVTVYPQSALITRRGGLSLHRGEASVRLQGLPGTLTPDSIRVEVAENQGLLLLDVSAAERPLEQPLSGEREKLEDQYRELLAEKKRLLARLANDQAELALFLNEENLAARFAREQYLPVNTANWKEFFDFARVRLRENRTLHREHLFALIDLERKIHAASANLSALPGPQESGHEINVTVHSPAEGAYTLGVSYLQERVYWYPVYAVSGEPGHKEITVTLSAVIGQQTGEDWRDVELLLSTAVPRFSCSLPEVRSMRLRERDAEIEMKKAAPAGRMRDKETARDEMPAEEPAVNDLIEEQVAPAPLRSRAAPKSAKARKKDLAMPAAPAPHGQSPLVSQSLDRGGDPDTAFGQATGPADQEGRYGGILREALERFTGEAPVSFDPAEESPHLTELIRVLAAGRTAPAPPEEQEGLPDWMSRGVSPLESLGGYDYRYPVPGKRDIPSRPVPAKVSVARKELPAVFTYVSVPLETEAVFLRADFANTKENPLPAGPAQVFSGDNLIGTLDFTTLGPGERGSVSLGAERDIKILRRQNGRRRRRGVVAKEVITDYTVEIEVRSFRDQAVRLEIYDRLPDARARKEITVTDFFADPAPLTTERGVLVWRLELSPHGQLMLRFRYAVRHPADYRLVMEEDPTPHQSAEEK